MQTVKGIKFEQNTLGNFLSFGVQSGLVTDLAAASIPYLLTPISL